MFNHPSSTPDLFQVIRNRVNVILLKIEMHQRDCPIEDNEKFWTDLHKDFEILSSLVIEKRSSKRLKTHKPTFIQKIFLYMISAILFLLIWVLYQLIDNHRDINRNRAARKPTEATVVEDRAEDPKDPKHFP